MSSLAGRAAVAGRSESAAGGVPETGARVGLEHAAAVDARAPLSMDARGHRRPDERIVAIADVLDLIVVSDLLHVRPVVELAADAVQHDLSVLQVLRMRTVNCTQAQTVINRVK